MIDFPRIMRTIAFDPGDATGIVTGEFIEGQDRAWRRTGAWIVNGGARGLALWLDENREDGRLHAEVVISEVFIPDGSAGGRETTSPRGEGVLEMFYVRGPEVLYQERSRKTVNMRSRETADARMKALGIWIETSEVNHTDARDANDAQLHTLWYLMNQRHIPTMKFWTAPPAPTAIWD